MSASEDKQDGRRTRWQTTGLRCLLAIVLLVLALPQALQAQTKDDFVPKSRHAILMDAATGAILYQHNAEQLMSPASMSKLMTAAMVFKALKAGTLKASDELVMSLNAWKTGGAPSHTSAMFVPLNTKARIDELLQGIIVQSGNDAAICVAEGLGGSEAKFAALMTEEGKRIGLKRSVFKNATGLHDPEHLMTARDLAVLARHIITDYPDYFPLFGQKEFKYRSHRFINRNSLLFASIGVDGMKTGHIKEAGYGMVVTTKQDQRRLIGVVSGLQSEEERKAEAQKLLEWGFRSFTEYRLFDSGEVVGRARVWGGDSMFVPLMGRSDIAMLLPRFPATQRLKADIVYKGPLKAPIRKGDVVGHLRVTSTSNAVVEAPLVAADDVGKAGMVRRGLDTLVHMALRWVLL